MNRLTLILIATSVWCVDVFGESVWTNTAGRVFTANLVRVTDSHLFFVMPDGATNRLNMGALHPDCQIAARKAFELPEIPDAIRATFYLTVKELRRVRYQHEDGKMDDTAYADFRRKLLTGFRLMYTRHGLPEDQRDALEKRLLNAAAMKASPEA